MAFKKCILTAATSLLATSAVLQATSSDSGPLGGSGGSTGGTETIGLPVTEDDSPEVLK